MSSVCSNTGRSSRSGLVKGTFTEGQRKKIQETCEKKKSSNIKESSLEIIRAIELSALMK